MTDALVAELRDALGPRGWLDPADAGSELTGWRKAYSGTPVLVARPDTVEAVQAVVRACADHAAAVVTQGVRCATSHRCNPPPLGEGRGGGEGGGTNKTNK